MVAASQINKAFLERINKATRADVLGTIAQHYQVTIDDALEAVTDDGAEHLLEYLTGPTRSAVRVLMQRHGLV